jgi:hypothetical protein
MGDADYTAQQFSWHFGTYREPAFMTQIQAE